MTPSDGHLFPGKFRGDEVKFLLPCQAPYEYGGVELDTVDHSSNTGNGNAHWVYLARQSITMFAYGDGNVTAGLDQRHRRLY